ncbi:MAG: acetyltransferase [Peptococcia bacterium]|jgi:sugar O-acyltransferase (sialic acid O-acetyltransferase NeuD family)
MAKLLILGAGGHGKVVADIALMMNKWEHIAFLDDKEGLQEIGNIPIIGRLEDYALFKEEFQYAFIAIGKNRLRLKWFEHLSQEGFIIPTIIHPFSSISKFSKIGAGTVVMGGVVINAGTSIGNACIINTSSSIDHDCVLADAVHISPGVNVGGTVNIGQCTWVCIGSRIVNNVDIGCNAVVAAGTAVINAVPNNVLVAGVPAIIKKRFEMIENES